MTWDAGSAAPPGEKGDAILYITCQNNPVDAVDPLGLAIADFIPVRFELVLVGAPAAVYFGLQGGTNYAFGMFVDPDEAREAREANEKIMARIRKIITTEGEMTFLDAGLSGKLGSMGTWVGRADAVDIYEGLLNPDGWVSAGREWCVRAMNRGWRGATPDEFAQTPAEREQLARALLYRHAAFQEYLEQWTPDATKDRDWGEMGFWSRTWHVLSSSEN